MTAFGDRSFQLLCAALLFLLVAAGLPQFRVVRAIYDVIAVLDITGSMNVRDQINGTDTVSRIAMEKAALRALLADLPCGSRLGAAVFVEERPFLLFEPVETCGNFAPLDEAISGIDWRMGWDSESHIAAGLAASLVAAKSMNADLIFMTDGQEMPPLSWSKPPNLAALKGAAGGLVVGIGGYAFVPIPKFDRAGREIGVWKAGEVPSETGGLFKGHEHLSAVDEPHLKTLAAQSGLTYLHLTTTHDLMPALTNAVKRRTKPSRTNLRFIPAALAFSLMAAAQFGMGSRK
jgi:mxaL protein